MRPFSIALGGVAVVLLAGGINVAAQRHATVKRERAAAAATANYAEVSAYSPAALAEAKASGRPILVAFQGKGCAECAAQQPAITQIEQDKSYKGLRVLLVDADTQKEALRELGATMRSTLVVFRGKNEVARSVGVTDSDTIRATVRRSLI